MRDAIYNITGSFTTQKHETIGVQAKDSSKKAAQTGELRCPRFREGERAPCLQRQPRLARPQMWWQWIWVHLRLVGGCRSLRLAFGLVLFGLFLQSEGLPGVNGVNCV